MDKTLYYMQKAIEQAEIAAAENEVPVGAVIVRNDEIVAEPKALKTSTTIIALTVIVSEYANTKKPKPLDLCLRLSYWNSFLKLRL